MILEDRHGEIMPRESVGLHRKNDRAATAIDHHHVASADPDSHPFAFAGGSKSPGHPWLKGRRTGPQIAQIAQMELGERLPSGAL